MHAAVSFTFRNKYEMLLSLSTQLLILEILMPANNPFPIARENGLLLSRCRFFLTQNN